MSSAVINLPSVDNFDFENDHLNSLINMDDLFSDIVSSLENNTVPEPPVAPMMKLSYGTPNPLATPLKVDTSFVPVTPSTSCSGLDEYEPSIEPTKLSEMIASQVPHRVSPIPAPSIKKNEDASKNVLVKKPNTKKRCRSVSNSSEEEGLDEEALRRERNRQHAKRSRLRKKNLTGDLQQSLKDLKEENAKLRSQLFEILGQKKTESLVQARMSNPAEQFVQNLKQPENRVVRT